jgi:probable HAF family extracellular repeat protein
VTLGVTDTADGTVTITGLPGDLGNFSGSGNYTVNNGGGTWTGSAADFNALSFTAGEDGTSNLVITETAQGQTTTETYTLTVNPVAEGPVLSGDVGTAQEHGVVTLGLTDTPVDTDDALGTVTITGLPGDLSNFSGNGEYTVSDGVGTWTGSGADFNALSFTAGEDGTFNLAVTATTSGAEAGSTTANYTLTISEDSNEVLSVAVATSGDPATIGDQITPTVTPSDTDPADLAGATTTYQWQVLTGQDANNPADWSNIDGATNATFAPGVEQAGETIRLAATVTTTEGDQATGYGAATAVNPALTGQTAETVNEHATGITLGVSETVAGSTVTISNLPGDLTFNGGNYDAGNGTWTGTDTQFNALSFTAGAPGTFDLTLTTSLGGEQTSQGYTLTVDPVGLGFSGQGLAGDIVTNFIGPITPSSPALPANATFTATDIHYGTSGFPDTLSAFLSANGQSDGQTISDPTVATGYNGGEPGDVSNFYLDMKGYILLTGEQTYTFATTSDDGSLLSISGTTIVDNNFSQGMTERSGTFTAAETGYYAIDVQYFQGGGGAGMFATYSGNGVSGDLTSAVLWQKALQAESGHTASMNLTDGDAFSTVTINDLPDDLSGFNGGHYAAGSDPNTGTWTGTAAEFNALTFTTGAVGAYALTITAADGSATAATSDTLVVTAPLAASSVTISAIEGASDKLVQVATFTDGDPNATLADFTATINWGDGSPAGTGTIVALQGGGFAVEGTHTYAAAGPFQVTATINDTADGSTANTTSSATVSGAGLSALPLTISAVEGQSTGSVPVASFTDADQQAKEFFATVNWGDGTNTDNARVVAVNGVFEVVDAHTYAEEGNYQVAVTIRDDDGNSTSTTGSAAVADVGAQGASVTATTALSTGLVQVATFTDPDAKDGATDFSATINWGDGSPAGTGTIVALQGGGFAVEGTHTYAQHGSYQVSATINDTADGSTASTTSSATVSNPALNALPLTISAVEGQSTGSAPVASFTDTDQQAKEFFATVNWGDGTSTENARVVTVNDVFAVVDAHTYAQEGSYQVAVTIRDDDGNSTSTTSSATVADAPPTVTTPTITSNDPVSSTVVREGDVLTASATGNGEDAVTYKWFSEATDALLGTGSTYTVTEANEGDSIFVEATSKNDIGATATAISDPTAQVLDRLPTVTTPTITSNDPAGPKVLREGDTLLSSATGNSDDTITYKWVDEAAAATFGTAQTFRLTGSDVGDAFQVVATSKNDNGATVQATSDFTAVVLEAPPVLGGTIGTAKEHHGLRLGLSDTAAFVDDHLGTVTISGLPKDLTSVNVGTYNAAAGTWTGTALELNNLSFRAGEDGTFNLTITATEADVHGNSTTKPYTLVIGEDPNEVLTVNVTTTGALAPGLQALSNPVGVLLQLGDKVNDSGEVVGAYQPTARQIDGFLFNGGIYTALNDPSATVSNSDQVQDGTIATGINDAGTVVGYYTAGVGFGPGQSVKGFVYNGSTYTTIQVGGETQTKPMDINDNGAIVGDVVGSNGAVQGFLKNGNSITAINVAGASATHATGINDSGEIVGYYISSNGIAHGFLDVNGTFTTLDDPDAVGQGAQGTFAEATNDAGQIVGFYTDQAGREHGFIYANGAWANFDDPSANETLATGISNSGEISGYAAPAVGNAHSFVLSPTPPLLILNNPGGTPFIGSEKINDSGEVVGAYNSTQFSAHGFIFDNGVYTILDDPSASHNQGKGDQSDDGTFATGINDSGDVVGFYTTDQGIDVTGVRASVAGFLYSGGSFTKIQDFAELQTRPQAINTSGEIVGWVVDDNDFRQIHGFWYDGNFHLFNVAGATSTRAMGVNDAGQIVGFDTDSQGVNHGFLDVNGTFTTLDDPNAGTAKGQGTFAQDINDAGQIVGYYVDSSGNAHGFLYVDGAWTNFDDPSAVGSTFATGISNSGEISGYSGTGSVGPALPFVVPAVQTCWR